VTADVNNQLDQSAIRMALDMLLDEAGNFSCAASLGIFYHAYRQYYNQNVADRQGIESCWIWLARLASRWRDA